mmetsp:Transcript_26113/g.89338  ORF Transcript_26113/g.89338 Transcript_26113/m.89338 type:complete len:171 (-) Transcript_26113:101-613(-)|eukprot:CAMPEP_0183790748 /NCGR_PEP_ID=MMETSP0803_2-20130417/1319_1 /TAXON_ID=195967 /ORGANISM="Crustomastix stigmata, Strain CCMP3273" /LENGTH=170 /DNA_ID=CAMNT_0026035011 /DNA_START=38 /DNA_END=550 /DNA_ORIENTATION=-
MLAAVAQRAVRSAAGPAPLLGARTFSVFDGLGTKVGQFSGAPEYIQNRKVEIFCAARTQAQQGNSQQGIWRISFGEQPKYENKLMGWTSTEDDMAHVGWSTLSFPTSLSAFRFAVRQGWTVTRVREPKEQGAHKATRPGFGKPGQRPKAYADNFSHHRKGIPIWEGSNGR